MLSLRNVHAAYGSVLALRSISLEAPEGGIIPVLGANGAGQSSTLLAISGLLPPSDGEIEFVGKSIARMPPEKTVQLGISPAYLSYMVHGKRPWRPDLHHRYLEIVNSVNRFEVPQGRPATAAWGHEVVVGGNGFEPMTSAMSTQRSRPLS